MTKKNNYKKGYALYTAIILTGVLILVSYVTANISAKELLFSISQADSHLAFYNADTGSECAMYWDVKNPNATPPGSLSAFDVSTSGNITCNNQTFTVGGGGNLTNTFTLNLSQGCATVSVTKDVVNGTTQIKSYGYNVCPGARRLERGITIIY